MAWWAGPTLQTASAQSGGDYVIRKSAIVGSGGTFHTGGGYRMGGMVGQHDAASLFRGLPGAPINQRALPAGDDAFGVISQARWT